MTNYIQQTNPLAQYIVLKDEINTAISNVLVSGSYILGRNVEEFESEFADYIGVTHGIGVANGTDGITIALQALGIRPGDEVITVSHTAVATVSAIENAGAIPVLVDIEPKYFTMDPDALKGAINAKTRAVVPVHLYGQSVELTKILNICKEYNLYLLEDASQAHGAKFENKRIGSFGHAAVFSCYPTKNLGALGDAGIIVTNNFDLSEKIKQLRQYGWKSRNESLRTGQNSRLDELQAAVLRVKLKHLEENNMKRNDIATIYDSELSCTPIELPQRRVGSTHVYHHYVIQCDERNNLQSHLEANGVFTGVHYPIPVHLQTGYSSKVVARGELSITTSLSKKILSLPIYPELDELDAYRVTKSIIEYFR